MIKKSISVFSLIFSTALFFCTNTLAMGLKVGPGHIDITDVPLGSKVSVSEAAGKPLCLQITNNSNMAYGYVINILYTAETTAPLGSGYEDIPDIGWIIPEEKEVRIHARQTRDVALYINIPNDAAYAGKKYQAVIEVQGKKNQPGDIFVLAAQVRISFSTEE
jgi:hypothetical protein